MLTETRGRAGRFSGRFLGRTHTICLRQSQRQQHWTSQECFDRMVWRRRAGANERILYKPFDCCCQITPCKAQPTFSGRHALSISQGYHVQITARSDRDLTPDGIIQKVADASGSKYSTGPPPPVAAATKPAVASKPAFTPTQSSGGGGYNPIRARAAQSGDSTIDADGWGADAPQVTRTQLEKVQPAYQRTQVDMRSLTSQQPSSPFNGSRSEQSSAPEPVRGAYQPIGKVDIAAIRAQAKQSGQAGDDRPSIVKGSYEPVGKVDIAAIRARAQPSSGGPAPSRVSPAVTGNAEEPPTRSLADRSAAFSSGPERLTSMPKPKVASKFGGGSTFTGTRAPLPGAAAAAPAAPVGVASRTFADEGGKTPAQIWAEKKARERGQSGSGDALPSQYSGQSPVVAQTSGGGEWKSGYAGKSWASVQTTHTGKSAGSSGMGQQRTGELPSQQEEQEEEIPSSPAGGISSIRDRFSDAAPMGAPAPASAFDRGAPEPDISNKPNRGIPIPGLPSPPPQPPRSPTPPTPEMRDTSPIRIAQPVARSAPVEDAHEEQMSPPPIMPVRSIPHADEDDEPETGPDPARSAAQSTAVASMGQEAVDHASAATQSGAGGERAKAEYDYEAAEDNEVSLREGEIVSNIEKIDPDWWVVTNEKGQSGLVPANYLVALEGDEDEGGAPPAQAAAAAAARVPEATPAEEEAAGAKATAQYDYEAAEDNELSFPENAVLHNVVCTSRSPSVRMFTYASTDLPRQRLVARRVSGQIRALPQQLRRADSVSPRAGCIWPEGGKVQISDHSSTQRLMINAL